MGITKYTGTVGAAALLTIALSGCATSPADCDPAKGGYLRGIGCASSGAYDQRQQDKATTLQREQARQGSLANEYRSTAATQKSVRAQRGQAEQQYASLRRDLSDMEKKLASSKSRNASLNQELADLKAKTSMLEKDTFTPEAEKASRLDQLMREKAALEREIEMALQR